MLPVSCFKPLHSGAFLLTAAANGGGRVESGQFQTPS